MKSGGNRKAMGLRSPVSGLVGWLVEQFKQRFKTASHVQPRLALLERITLAPRQSLALVEAEGRRFLVASSSESGPVFYALDNRARSRRVNSRNWGRIS